MKNIIIDGIMGLCVADALGVPVEFIDRETLRNNPVDGMRSYGTHNQPAGTWSDDTSMALCLIDSLADGLNYGDIMAKFSKWIYYGEYTPYGEVFDVGISTGKALSRFSGGTAPLKCGGVTEHDNGNGSLMRILPILFYLQANYGKEITEYEEAMKTIHNVSALTHAHKRSKIACGVYCSIAAMLLGNMGLSTAVSLGINRAFEFYKRHDEHNEELHHYERLIRKSFPSTPEEEIKSSGYVVDTLEAAIWCLLNTDNYKDCVLMAVNLGEDTDTVAAVVGGLAGLYYGYDSIPQEWLSVIVKRDYVVSLCNQLYTALNKASVDKLCKYIPYFENATKDSACHWSGGEKLGEKHYTSCYPVYDNILQEFISEFYKTNLICYDYFDATHNKGLNGTEDMNSVIDTADFELLKAILTEYIRQERFCDGLWELAVEDKVFLKILQRFKKLSDSI